MPYQTLESAPGGIQILFRYKAPFNTKAMELTPEALAQETLQKRLQDAREEIKVTLEKHGVLLKPQIAVTVDGIVPYVNLVDASAPVEENNDAPKANE